MSDDITEISADAADMEQGIILKAELERVLELVDGLPAKECMVVQLKYLHDMDFRQIAASVGISEESVHKYISRTRSRIKASFYREEGRG